MNFCLILVVNFYRWSFSSSELRTSHWAYESSCFVHSILWYLVEESELPDVVDVRASVCIDLDGLVVSETKLSALREEFVTHMECFECPGMFEENVALVKDFMLMVVVEILGARGMKEDVTFHMSVCCPALLLLGDPDVLSAEVNLFTDLLVDLRQVTAVENRRLDRSFSVFLAKFRQITTDVTSDSASSAIKILRACNRIPVSNIQEKFKLVKSLKN